MGSGHRRKCKLNDRWKKPALTRCVVIYGEVTLLQEQLSQPEFRQETGALCWDLGTRCGHAWHSAVAEVLREPPPLSPSALGDAAAASRRGRAQAGTPVTRPQEGQRPGPSAGQRGSRTRTDASLRTVS